MKKDRVYQKLINNCHNDEFVFDMRVPVFKKTIPFVHLKYKPINDRFSLSIKGTLEEVNNVLTPEEVKNILHFCENIGLDYGELDILRNKSDGKIYIVDVNNTPTIHLAGLTNQQKHESFIRMSNAFNEAFAFR